MMQSQPPLTPRVQLDQINGQWYMTYHGHQYGPGSYPPITVDANRKGDFTFTIKSGANFDLTGPISVAKGNAKPDGLGIYNQINVTSKADSVLKFSDSNTEKTDLNYVLHFTDGTKLDPIIQNGGGCCHMVPGVGGGGISFTSRDFYAGALIGLVAGIVLTIVVRALFRRG